MYTKATDFDLAHTYRNIPFAQMLPIQPTLLSYLADHVRTHGDDPFVTTVAPNGHIVTFSYHELDVFSQRLAYWLRHHAQAHPGDVFALLPANEMLSIVTIFALLRSGCAILLLNPNDPPSRLRQQIAAIQVKALLCVPGVTNDSIPEALPVPETSTLHKDGVSDTEPRIESSADALFFGTSGSTAAAKLVAQSHYNATVNAIATCRHHGLRHGDRVLGCLPIYHVNCLHFTIFATLVAGAHAMLVHSFDPFGYRRLIEQFRPRIASVVPGILEALLGTWRQPTFPGEFNYFVSAAAPLSVRTARDVVQKMSVRVLQGYGLTETTNFSTTVPPDLSKEEYQRLMLDTEIPSIGTAFYGNEVAILSADGEQVTTGEIGEICMRGHNIMMRYADNTAETSAAFRNGWFHSQDLGFAIKDSTSGRSSFVITGRTKNIAKVRGETVSLDELERVLRALPYVRDAACATVPHRLLGDEILAAVVLSDGTHDIALHAHLQSSFSPNAIPRRIVELDAIPRTPTGKILRRELAKKLASPGDTEASQ